MDRRAGIDANSGDVAAWARQALSQTLRDGVSRKRHDGKLGVRIFEKYGTGPDDVDDFRIAAENLGRQCRGAGFVLIAAKLFDLEVLPLDVPEPPQLLEQGPVIAVLALLMHQRRRLGRTKDREPTADACRLCRDAREAGDRHRAGDKLSSSHSPSQAWHD